ncbi:hypothetical protein BC830DRAFT_1175654, partial [Chytriomyces sp. MP71]
MTACKLTVPSTGQIVPMYFDITQTLLSALACAAAVLWAFYYASYDEHWNEIVEERVKLAERTYARRERELHPELYRVEPVRESALLKQATPLEARKAEMKRTTSGSNDSAAPNDSARSASVAKRNSRRVKMKSSDRREYVSGNSSDETYETQSSNDGCRSYNDGCQSYNNNSSNDSQSSSDRQTLYERKKSIHRQLSIQVIERKKSLIYPQKSRNKVASLKAAEPRPGTESQTVYLEAEPSEVNRPYSAKLVNKNPVTEQSQSKGSFLEVPVTPTDVPFVPSVASARTTFISGSKAVLEPLEMTQTESKPLMNHRKTLSYLRVNKTLALKIMILFNRPSRIFISGLAIALSVLAMHHLGINSIRMEATYT